MDKPAPAPLSILILSTITLPEGRYGTEIVADDLARLWSELGHRVVRAGPAGADVPLEAWTEGPVRIAPLPPSPPLTRMATFERRSPSVPGLDRLVAETAPDVAMIVGFSPGTIDLAHLEVLAARGVPMALWHHVPGVTCLQFGLRYKNRAPCDGEVLVQRCTACRLGAGGAPEWTAEVASRIEIPGMTSAPPGKLGHMLSGRLLTRRFAESVQALRRHFGHVYVGANWVRDVLMRNGFAATQISLVRPGLREDLAKALQRGAGLGAPSPSPTLRLANWGRLDDTKGVDTLIRAVQRLEGVDLRVGIAGGGTPGSGYADFLKSLAGGDPRIAFLGRLGPAAMSELLTDSDAAVLPSTWLETGPLTVFEAHAARLPILGSAVGGIGEVCGPDPSARVFPRDDDAALAALIAERAAAPAEAIRRRALVPKARTMRDAAHEMLPAMEVLAMGALDQTRNRSALL